MVYLLEIQRIKFVFLCFHRNFISIKNYWFDYSVLRIWKKNIMLLKIFPFISLHTSSLDAWRQTRRSQKLPTNQHKQTVDIRDRCLTKTLRCRNVSTFVRLVFHHTEQQHWQQFNITFACSIESFNLKRILIVECTENTIFFAFIWLFFIYRFYYNYLCWHPNFVLNPNYQWFSVLDLVRRFSFWYFFTNSLSVWSQLELLKSIFNWLHNINDKLENSSEFSEFFIYNPRIHLIPKEISMNNSQMPRIRFIASTILFRF